MSDEGLPTLSWELCQATMRDGGYVWRCDSEKGHAGKHVGTLMIDGEAIDQFWKDSDRGARIDGAV